MLASVPTVGATPFGRLVKQWREKWGWSQVRLGKEAGVDGSYINMLESGRRGIAPSAEVVWDIARAMDAPVYEFLHASGWLEPFRSFIESDPNLTPSQRRVLTRLYEQWLKEA